jgi:hypothetical protein
MALFPNNSNDGPPLNLPQRHEGDYGLSPARAEAAKRQARKWFAILLSLGLVLGTAMAIGVVKLIDELGLNQKPDRPLLSEPLQKQ